MEMKYDFYEQLNKKFTKEAERRCVIRLMVF